MPPRCFAYLRVSTERQAGEVYTSLADQRAAISRLAASLGVTVDEWFSDEGASGATAERRPAFMRLLSACQREQRTKRDPGYVLVLNDSRFGRFGDIDEAAHWRVTFRKLGWLVRFCEGDDAGDGFARSIVRLAASAQASEYLKNLKANATRGSRGAAAQGYWVSSAPFGYRRAVVYPAGRERVLDNGTPKAKDEKIRLAIHEPEAAIVREAFARYAQPGATLASVFDWIAIVAPARKWSVPAVRWLLSNPAYVGDVVIGRRMADEDDPGRLVFRQSGERWGMDNAHEAIVSRDDFEAAAAKLAANAAAPRRARSDYPLSGILRCSDCGGPYVGAGTKHGVSIYRCKASVFGGCSGGGVAKHLIEPAVIGNIAELLSSPAMRRRIKAQAEKMLAGFAKPAKDRSLVDAEAKARARQTNVVNAIADGTLTQREAEASLNAIRKELARIESAKAHERLTAARHAAMLAERDSIIAQVLDAPARLQGASSPEIRGLLALWCQSLTYNRSTRRVRMEIRTAVPVLSSSGAGAACRNSATVVVREVELPRRALRFA